MEDGFGSMRASSPTRELLRDAASGEALQLAGHDVKPRDAPVSERDRARKKNPQPSERMKQLLRDVGPPMR
jgi:hypothetical protein